MELNYHSIEALLNTARENNCRLSKLVLDQQAEQMEMPREKYTKKCEIITKSWHLVLHREALRI